MRHDNPHVHSDNTEARIKVRLAAAHLRIAEAGGFDAALATLLGVALGKREDGSPMDVAPRTRAQAAALLLRCARDVLPGPPPPQVVVDARRQEVTIGPIEDPAAYLQRFLEAARESGMCTLSSPEEGTPAGNENRDPSLE